ncbi:halocarboxylic acid dehydrogenase DehI family protein [Haloarcula nitratireducens]|uniref:Halocarboxylic acid dehydrogenase DehI family protein n=1 Tax=Haloarcula nitratireducens TaxID=2487749 RepID=A0AAW4PF38_9EURY|nr:halocarboxylic acid dehydrogenase DehI family protein [Halomicroarcula nitratireducens]MBX0295887.1 halocarboxylic acid dehydrogenase DehI family protein [Halomicroarcula nitratireducens]
MDTSEQLYEAEATGWKRGVYDDVQATFRAPVVNWIWRTTMANYPEFCRYLWSQVKPVFETRAFGRFSVRYRDAVLSAVESDVTIPAYRRTNLDVAPAEYTELRGQLATFDVVAPRLAVLFRVTNRALHGEPVGADPGTDCATTAPFPDWLDADRGRTPSMVPFDEFGEDAAETAAAFRRFHGFDDGLASIYRCLAQWPTLFDALWTDLGPVLESETFETACDRADERTDAFVDGLPYSPRLGPDALREYGFDDGLIGDVQALFREFDEGAVDDVLPGIHLWAASVDSVGERDW